MLLIFSLVIPYCSVGDRPVHVHVCEEQSVEFPWIIPSDNKTGVILTLHQPSRSLSVLQKDPGSVNYSSFQHRYHLNSSKLVLSNTTVADSGSYTLHLRPSSANHKVELIVHSIEGLYEFVKGLDKAALVCCFVNDTV